MRFISSLRQGHATCPCHRWLGEHSRSLTHDRSASDGFVTERDFLKDENASAWEYTRFYCLTSRVPIKCAPSRPEKGQPMALLRSGKWLVGTRHLQPGRAMCEAPGEALTACHWASVPIHPNVTMCNAGGARPALRVELHQPWRSLLPTERPALLARSGMKLEVDAGVAPCVIGMKFGGLVWPRIVEDEAPLTRAHRLGQRAHAGG